MTDIGLNTVVKSFDDQTVLDGVFGVDPMLIEVAQGMGLTHRQRLRLIEFSLVMPMILVHLQPGLRD